MPKMCNVKSFNTQPPEGGWTDIISTRLKDLVSTHSRLKAAGGLLSSRPLGFRVSTHSRLKAAGYNSTIN